MWPSPKASRDVVLKALNRLKQEFTAVYVETAATVSQAALPKPGTSLAELTASLAPKRARQEQDSAPEKLKQVLEQPLVLEAALKEATARAAAELWAGATPEDLESELERYGSEVEVVQTMEEVQAMHQACLEGRNVAPEDVRKAMHLWRADEVLQMLRELGLAKASALEALMAAPSHQASVGARAVEVCARAEDIVWERCWPGDARRRCSFHVALQGFSAEKRSFLEKRVALEAELERNVKTMQ
mmetsp:Transcript_143151/g.247755  ORF Transcript_143151/g.247755 Transcript_143151/m.247755 type:complete len:245 (+) Transcript_143151:63-797(+)